MSPSEKYFVKTKWTEQDFLFFDHPFSDGQIGKKLFRTSSQQRDRNKKIHHAQKNIFRML